MEYFLDYLQEVPKMLFTVPSKGLRMLLGPTSRRWLESVTYITLKKVRKFYLKQPHRALKMLLSLP